jgi:DNA-binding transcriptional LysR family regulator
MLHPVDETIDRTDVQLFVAVARQASFVKASRRTGVPTSTLSRAVARLEKSLGVRLLHRTSRRVSPTHEGERLLARASPLMDELREVLGDVTDREEEPAGRLRVTAPVVTGSERIGRALIAYAAAHPCISMDLCLTNSVLNLVEEGFDLAFRVSRARKG